MFIAIKTEDGSIKGKISFYCKVLGITREGFHNYLKTKDLPWKYQSLADAMLDICAEEECNDTYGRIRMLQALQVKLPEGVYIHSGALFTVKWKELVSVIDFNVSQMVLQKQRKKPINQMI